MPFLTATKFIIYLTVAFAASALATFGKPTPKAIRGIKPEEETKTTRVLDKKIKNKPALKPVGRLISPPVIPDFIEPEEPDFTDQTGENDGLRIGVEGGNTDEGLDIDDLFGKPDGGTLKPGGYERISVRQAKRIKYVKPVYSKIAKDARVFGMVVIEAKTDVFGNVVNWKVISGHSLLNGSAINAIKRWKYEPYLVGGIPKVVVFRVTINFTLQQ